MILLVPQKKIAYKVGSLHTIVLSQNINNPNNIYGKDN